MHIIWINILLEYCQRIAYMYIFTYLVMLKAFDTMGMSKCKYVKSNNTIVTASRGRLVKVKLF